jgi:hypothetical protein
MADTGVDEAAAASRDTVASGDDKTLLCSEAELHQVRHIGKYEVTRYLGHGAMGRVFLGKHPDLDLPVAIKVIDDRHATDPVYRRQFLQEARLASQINHPNVIRIYDADQDGGTCFMVQEYVDGGDVAALIHRSAPGGLAVRDALRIVTGVSAGLVAAEKLRIVHRDVKPSNILLTRDGEPKLADLGLARKTRHDAEPPPTEGTLTHPGSTVGTPAYMAPEQILSAGQIDVRADIYALGATLFEMLTGQPPFPGTSAQDIMRRHLQDPVRDPRELNPQVPRRVTRLVRRMLAKRPEDRPPTAAALQRDLVRVCQPFPYGRLLGWWAAALVVLALLAGVLRQRGTGRDEGLAQGLSLLARGQYDQALTHLQAARQRRPHDQLAIYALGLCQLSRRNLQEAEAAQAELAATTAGSTLADLIGLQRRLEPAAAGPAQHAMAQICELAALAKARVAVDDWSSSPTILLFLGPDGSGVTPAEASAATLWLDGLEAGMLQQDRFPVVNRTAMEQVLQELQISATDLGDPRARLKLGQLLPASVLIQSSFAGHDGLCLSLKLVDVATSEILGVLRRDALDLAQRQQTLADLVEELSGRLAGRVPLRGRVEAVSADVAEINLGRCHGLTVGQELEICRAPRGAPATAAARAPAVARARVTRADRFGAEVRVQEASAALSPGMLVRTAGRDSGTPQ